MTRQTRFILAMIIGLALQFGVPPIEAQISMGAPARFEITPVAGYLWGGSFATDASSTIPAGDLEIDDSFGWGVTLSFLPQPHSAVELIYLRQDTDVRFDPLQGTTTNLGGFATNYIHIGGRQEFPTAVGLRPFVTGSLGITVFDPKAEGIGTSTRFSVALGGGVQHMLGEAQRVGLRADLRIWFTPVPSGDYGTWCDFYGCFVVEGTDWVNQGQVSGGLVFAF